MRLIKNYKILLVLAALSFAVDILISIIYDQNFETPPIRSTFSDMGYFSYFIVGCLVMPIVEEISYRSWVSKKKWVRIIGYILFFVFLYSLFTSIFLTIFFTLLYISLEFILKEKALLKNYIYIIFTGTLFVLAHSLNLEPKQFSYQFLGYVWGALLFSYIVIRYGLKYSMIVHGINNLILLLISLFALSSTPDTTIKGSNYNASFEKYLFLDQYDSKMDSAKHDKVIIGKNLTLIAKDLIDNKWDYNIKIYSLSYNRYNLVCDNINDSVCFNKADLLKKLIAKTSLKIDTIREKRTVYFVQTPKMDASKKIISKDKLPIYSELELISKDWSELLMLDKGQNPLYLVDDISKKNSRSEKSSFKEVLENLEKENKLKLRKVDTIITSIRIFEYKD